MRYPSGDGIVLYLDCINVSILTVILLYFVLSPFFFSTNLTFLHPCVNVSSSCFLDFFSQLVSHFMVHPLPKQVHSCT